MSYERSAIAYGAAAADGATQGALTQLVYQHLAKDLINAAVAVRDGDVSRRCQTCRHAVLLLGHLESWVTYIDDPSLADSLRIFYQELRRSILRMSAMLDSNGLEQLAQQIIETGMAWQTKESSLRDKCRVSSANTLSEDEMWWSA